MFKEFAQKKKSSPKCLHAMSGPDSIRSSLSSPPSISRRINPEEEAPPGEEAAGGYPAAGEAGAGEGTQANKIPLGRCSFGSAGNDQPGSTGSQGGAGRAGQPGPPASPGASLGSEPGTRPVRSAARRHRGHGLPAEPAEQPGGGEH